MSELSREHFASDEEFERTSLLRADRNALCWEAVRELREEEKLMSEWDAALLFLVYRAIQKL